MIEPKKEFMEIAIQEAIKAKERGDYAVGAVIIKGNEIIAKSGNRVKTDEDPVHHAEVFAIREAAKKLGTRYLKDCVLYTTHEPCPMCASAAMWAKIEGIVSGAKIEDMSAYSFKNSNNDWSWRTINIPASKILQEGNPKLFLIEEFMREECKKLFHS